MFEWVQKCQSVQICHLKYSVLICTVSPWIYAHNMVWSDFVQRPISQIPKRTCSISHKCTIQNKNVHIYVLTGALWDMGQVHCGICEFGFIISTVVDRGGINRHMAGFGHFFCLMTGSIFHPFYNVCHGNRWTVGSSKRVHETLYIRICFACVKYL